MSAVIAIVEEDQPLAEATRRLLESSGWTSRRYCDGESFLAALESVTQPGCLILNLELPGISGLTVLRSLARRGHRIPTVAVTDRPGEPLVDEALAAGASRVLTMPYRSEDLMEIVASLAGVDPVGPEQSPRFHGLARRRSAVLRPPDRVGIARRSASTVLPSQRSLCPLSASNR